MKILLVNTFDYGGAGKACLRLHEGLREENLHNELLVLHSKLSSEHSNDLLKTKKKKKSKSSKIKRRIKELLRVKFKRKVNGKQKEIFLSSRNQGLELFSFPDTPYDITQTALYKEADIINLHWTAGFLDFESFFEQNTKPVVWTLHDVHPITAGEHYNEEYLGMDKRGYPIKRVLNKEELKMQKLLRKRLVRIIGNKNNLFFVAPSKWILNEAINSKLVDLKKITHIPNGLDSDLFRQYDRKATRVELGLPNDEYVILFVANNIENQRKGFKYLLKSFDKLDRKDVHLCAIGSVDSAHIGSLNVNYLGNIVDESQMSKIYSASDIFVIPSLIDNLPNTVIESLMCGTPVIGFPVGGIVDMIQHRENGLLTKEISVNALTDTINDFLEKGVELSSTDIRKRAISKYNLDVQAKAYKELFCKINERNI